MIRRILTSLFLVASVAAFAASPGGAPAVVDTLTDLLARIPQTSNPHVIVLGHTNAGDWKFPRLFRYESGNTNSADGTNYFTTATGNGRWVQYDVLQSSTLLGRDDGGDGVMRPISLGAGLSISGSTISSSSLGDGLGTNVFVNGLLVQPARFTNDTQVLFGTNGSGDIVATLTNVASASTNLIVNGLLYQPAIITNDINVVWATNANGHLYAYITNYSAGVTNLGDLSDVSLGWLDYGYGLLYSPDAGVTWTNTMGPEHFVPVVGATGLEWLEFSTSSLLDWDASSPNPLDILYFENATSSWTNLAVGSVGQALLVGTNELYWGTVATGGGTTNFFDLNDVETGGVAAGQLVYINTNAVGSFIITNNPNLVIEYETNFYFYGKTYFSQSIVVNGRTNSTFGWPRTILVNAAAWTPGTNDAPAAVDYGDNDAYLFSDSATNTLLRSMPVPRTWASNDWQLRIYTATTQTNQSLASVWSAEARLITRGGDLQPSWGTAVYATNSCLGTNLLQAVTFDDITPSGTPAYGQLIQFRLQRLPGHASDDLAAAEYFLDSELQYTESENSPTGM